MISVVLPLTVLDTVVAGSGAGRPGAPWIALTETSQTYWRPAQELKQHHQLAARSHEGQCLKLDQDCKAVVVIFPKVLHLLREQKVTAKWLFWPLDKMLSRHKTSALRRSTLSLKMAEWKITSEILSPVLELNSWIFYVWFQIFRIFNLLYLNLIFLLTIKYGTATENKRERMREDAQPCGNAGQQLCFSSVFCKERSDSPNEGFFFLSLNFWGWIKEPGSIRVSSTI